MYWTGDRDVMVQRMQRAHDAGAKGLIATLDWSFSMGRDWGSPEIPDKVDLFTMVRFAPAVATQAALALRVRQVRPAARPDHAQPGSARGRGADVLRGVRRVDADPAADLGGRGLDA